MAKPEQYKTTLSTDQSAALCAAYDYFNTHLFGGELDPCMVLFNRNSKHIGGYYSPARWGDGETESGWDEIGLNSNLMQDMGMTELLSVLVHEMTHKWQQTHGTPGAHGYHNAEWADKMDAHGLPPDNGSGGRTGRTLHQKVDEGGKFYSLVCDMPDECWIPYYAEDLQTEPPQGGGGGGEGDSEGQEQQEEKPNSTGTRIRYCCPACGIKLWGGRNLNVLCVDCNQMLVGG